MKLTDLAPPKVVSASEVGHAADKFPESDLPFYRKLGRTSDLHHYIYSSMSGALLNLCGRRSSVREKVVLATVTYIKSPEMAIAALLDQFEELGID